jgi:NAD(P)-dependent dehydrogenase (short-subunit alcohol dehydrogenase family)
MIFEKSAVAVVSGGASGLGAATARKLTSMGAYVAIFDLNVAAGEAVAQELGGVFHCVDVADPASVADGFEAVVGAIGVPRIMINCAGIAPAMKTVSRGTPHDATTFEKTIQINLIGSFNCSSQAACLMAASDPCGPDDARGVIINTASVAAYDGQIGQVAYSASKGGIVGMTLPMARDLADKGIRVCAVAPGIFATPMVQGMPQDVQDALGAQVPFPRRLGAASEYADLVGHIVDNQMLNGEVIRLDGAIRMAPR